MLYANGQGLAKKAVEATKWYCKAAEQGNSFAQSSLGELYDRRIGVHQDAAEARKWLVMAADQGNAKAQEK